MSNTDFVREWVAALRGGNYKQCFGEVRSNKGDKFCALGVLCDLRAKKGVAVWCKVEDMWYIKTSETTSVIPLDLNFGIIDLNDRQHKTFGEIADYIDEYYNSRKFDVQPVSA